jgi:Cdc6-like AAA superfamily ATPase
MNEKEKQLLIANIRRAFSPSAPIDRYNLFAGRTNQIHDVINAITQRGQHVVIFGERGVGKTSLANILSEILLKAGVHGIKSCKVNCDGGDDFSSLWHKVLREFSITQSVPKMGFIKNSLDEEISLERLASDEIAPDDVRLLLSHVNYSTVVIIDEIDRIKDRKVTSSLADTVKTLSDNSVSTTLIFIGIADNVSELIAEHQSIERNLVQIPMPRMSPTELLEILDKALNVAEMTMADDAKAQIAELSQGLPHYAHLLGLYAAEEAVNNNQKNITEDNLAKAIYSAVDKAQQSIRSAYHKATSSARKTLYAEVLLACAIAKTDEMGYFAATDLRGPMTKIMGKQYNIPAFSRHLNDFCEDKRGPILQKKGFTRRFRFRFINPLMQPFVFMHGLTHGLLKEI